MDSSNLEQDIINIVAEKLGIESHEISLDKTFEELGADRLYKIVVVGSIEDEYNIMISNRDFESFVKVGDIVDYLRGNPLSPKGSIANYSM